MRDAAHASAEVGGSFDACLEPDGTLRQRFDFCGPGGDKRAAGAEVNDIDGVRVSSKDGWWLLRASNTEPALVLRCEASDQAALDRLKAEVTAQLEQSGLDVPGL